MGGRGWAGWSSVKGRKWDNCNSVINKYIKKKKNPNNLNCGLWAKQWDGEWEKKYEYELWS